VPLLYASSAATYGDGSRGFDDRTPPSELTPLNLYGKSKNDFDAWALAEVAAGTPQPPKWVGLKFFNVYGPRESHKGRMASVVYQTWRQVKATGAMKLFRSTDPRFADGGQLRDFVFVGDCVNHLLWLWKQPRRAASTTPAAARRERFSTSRVPFSPRWASRRGSRSSTCRPIWRGSTRTSRARRCRSCGPRAERFPATALEDGVRQTVGWLEGGADARRGVKPLAASHRRHRNARADPLR
jgi:ADP-L-glycero-D-manno-heptose 6-epimerase